MISTKNLLLPNYYVQSSITYIINITENIYTALCVGLGAITRRWAPQTRYMLCHNTASIMRGLRKIFLKNYCGSFAFTNSYMYINYVIL